MPSQDHGGYLTDLSAFKVDVIARNPKREQLATLPLSALVDTGSELTWLPADILRGIGITPRRKRVFATATQQRIEREIGYAILSAEGYETNDEVVFAEPGDMTLLGVRTLGGFGVMVDNIAHRFVATTTVVAANCEEGSYPNPTAEILPVTDIRRTKTPRHAADPLKHKGAVAWIAPTMHPLGTVEVQAAVASSCLVVFSVTLGGSAEIKPGRSDDVSSNPAVCLAESNIAGVI